RSSVPCVNRRFTDGPVDAEPVPGGAHGRAAGAVGTTDPGREGPGGGGPARPGVIAQRRGPVRGATDAGPDRGCAGDAREYDRRAAEAVRGGGGGAGVGPEGAGRAADAGEDRRPGRGVLGSDVLLGRPAGEGPVDAAPAGGRVDAPRAGDVGQCRDGAAG